MSKPAIHNFLFHRISPERDVLWDPVDVQHFEKCIRYISSHYEVVQVEQLPELINNSGTHRYATITFDDGYKDNFIYALPVLEKYGIKASFYVVTDCIEKNEPTWTHVTEYLFQHTSKKEINLDFDFLAGEYGVKEIAAKHDRTALAKKLVPCLKLLSNEQRLKVMERITATFNDVKIPGLMMSWDDLKTLHAKGHYIGSHTVSHGMLEKMSGDEEIMHELTRSRNIIQEHLGYFPSTIAYPIGNYTSHIIELCKKSGYRIGLATKQDVYLPGRDDIFEIPRIELRNESWVKTLLRITNLLEVIKRRIHYRTHLLIGFGLLELSLD